MRDKSSTSPLALFAGQQTEVSSDPFPGMVLEYYHQAVFYHIGEAYRERIQAALYERPSAFRTEAFLARLSPGREYMAQVLARHSVFFWIHLYRRIGVWLGPNHIDKTDPNTLGLVRQIVELAISKHGDLTLDNDVALSSEIRVKDVLGGHYQRFWEKRLGRAAAVEKFRALVESKQWVLTRFRLRDFFDLHLVEGYAYEYWHVSALMRAIGKGSGFLVEDSGWPKTIETAKLSELIISYDQRITRQPFSTALLGSWFHVQIDLRSRSGTMFVPVYNVEQRPFEAVEAFGVRAPFGSHFVSNFLVGNFDVEAFRNAHAFLADAFKDATGFSLDAYLLCIWALANIVFLPARVLLAEQRDQMDILDPKGSIFLNFLNLLQRAYSLFPNDSARLVDEILFRSVAYEGHRIMHNATDVANCVDQLTLTEDKRTQIALWSGGKRFPLVRFGRALVIDLQGIPSLLQTLFYRVPYKQAARGSVFEDAFRAALAVEKFELIPFREIVSQPVKSAR